MSETNNHGSKWDDQNVNKQETELMTLIVKIAANKDLKN